MHVSLHLVALDNRFVWDYPLLIVSLSILNPLTPTRCLQWQNKMALSNIPLPWAHFIFLFLLFQVRSLITIITCLSSPWTSSYSTTRIGPSYLVTHLDTRINPNRFHQVTKTKLGLSPYFMTALRLTKYGGRLTCCKLMFSSVSGVSYACCKCFIWMLYMLQ
jgi:hypothetical protein